MDVVVEERAMSLTSLGQTLSAKTITTNKPVKSRSKSVVREQNKGYINYLQERRIKRKQKEERKARKTSVVSDAASVEDDPQAAETEKVNEIDIIQRKLTSRPSSAKYSDEGVHSHIEADEINERQLELETEDEGVGSLPSSAEEFPERDVPASQDSNPVMSSELSSDNIFSGDSLEDEQDNLGDSGRGSFFKALGDTHDSNSNEHMSNKDGISEDKIIMETDENANHVSQAEEEITNSNLIEKSIYTQFGNGDKLRKSNVIQSNVAHEIETNNDHNSNDKGGKTSTNMESELNKFEDAEKGLELEGNFKEKDNEDNEFDSHLDTSEQGGHEGFNVESKTENSTINESAYEGEPVELNINDEGEQYDGQHENHKSLLSEEKTLHDTEIEQKNEESENNENVYAGEPMDLNMSDADGQNNGEDENNEISSYLKDNLHDNQVQQNEQIEHNEQTLEIDKLEDNQNSLETNEITNNDEADDIAQTEPGDQMLNDEKNGNNDLNDLVDMSVDVNEQALAIDLKEQNTESIDDKKGLSAQNNKSETEEIKEDAVIAKLPSVRRKKYRKIKPVVKNKWDDSNQESPYRKRLRNSKLTPLSQRSDSFKLKSKSSHLGRRMKKSNVESTAIKPDQEETDQPVANLEKLGENNNIEQTYLAQASSRRDSYQSSEHLESIADNSEDVERRVQDFFSESHAELHMRRPKGPPKRVHLAEQPETVQEEDANDKPVEEAEVWIPEEDKVYVYRYSSEPRVLQMKNGTTRRVTAISHWNDDPSSAYRLTLR